MFRPSVIALVLSNVFSLMIVLLFGGGVGEIMLLYWLENVIVGFYNIPKMILVDARKSLVMVPFFVVHYGIFAFVHGIFVRVIFVKGDVSMSNLVLAALPIFVSHGVSLFTNFIDGQEYRNKSADAQMVAPYARVIVLHLAVLLSGFFVMFLGLPIIALVLLAILKIFVDLRGHEREHGFNI